MKELIDFLEKKGLKQKAESLKNGATWLELSCKQIGDTGARVLAEVLKTNTFLTHLNLGSNQIGDTGAKVIAEALKTNTALTQLKLSLNEIEDEGTKVLAETLKTNSSLTQLSLLGNQIGAAGARGLADALKINTALTELDLRSSQIGEAGARVFAEALKINTALTELDLSWKQIGDAGDKEIEGYLQRNKNLAEKKAETLNVQKLEAKQTELVKKQQAELEAKQQAELLLLKQQLELSEKQAKLAKLAKEKAEKEYKEQQQAKLKESDQIKNEKVELTPIQEQKTYAVNETNKGYTNELIQKLILDLTSKIGKNTDISEDHKPVMQKQVGEISSLINATNLNKTNIEIVKNKIIDIAYANKLTKGMLIDLEEEIKDILEHQMQQDKAFEAFEQTVAEMKSKLDTNSTLKPEAKAAFQQQINSVVDKTAGLVNKDDIQKITNEMKNLIAINKITKGRLIDLEDSVDQLIEQQNSIVDNNVKVNMVNEIIYDNPLLNHPELLQSAMEKFSLKEIGELSTRLSPNLIMQAISSGYNEGGELILGGLMSLEYNEAPAD